MWWWTSNCSPLLIYRRREDERLSWPGWLNYSGRLTHISGHPSATGRAQDGKKTLARDWRSTAKPRGPTIITIIMIIMFSRIQCFIWIQQIDEKYEKTLKSISHLIVRHTFMHTVTMLTRLCHSTTMMMMMLLCKAYHRRKWACILAYIELHKTSSVLLYTAELKPSFLSPQHRLDLWHWYVRAVLTAAETTPTNNKWRDMKLVVILQKA